MPSAAPEVVNIIMNVVSCSIPLLRSNCIRRNSVHFSNVFSATLSNIVERFAFLLCVSYH